MHTFLHIVNIFMAGNDILHYLLSQGRYKMRMDMADFDNQTRYVKYSYFNVGDEASKYYMTIFGHSGDVGNKLMEFRYSLIFINMLIGFSNDQNFIFSSLPMTLLLRLIDCPFPA